MKPGKIVGNLTRSMLLTGASLLSCADGNAQDTRPSSSDHAPLVQTDLEIENQNLRRDLDAKDTALEKE